MRYSTKDNIAPLNGDGKFFQPTRNEEVSWNKELGNTWRHWQPKQSDGLYDREPRIHEGYSVQAFYKADYPNDGSEQTWTLTGSPVIVQSASLLAIGFALASILSIVN